MSHSERVVCSPHSVASEQNISEILAAVEEKTGSLRAIIVRIVGYSGLRRRELAGLRWRDIDFKNGCAILRATKSGHDRCVVLGPDALLALLELRRCVPDSEYVLGGDMPSVVPRAMVDPRVLAGKPLSFHSLRRIFWAWIARTRGDRDKA